MRTVRSNRKWTKSSRKSSRKIWRVEIVFSIASALNDYCTRWCKREHVESNALNNWKLKIFKIIDAPVLFYSNNLELLPPKPKLSL